jgi:hypothetical protein
VSEMPVKHAICLLAGLRRAPLSELFVGYGLHPVFVNVFGKVDHIWSRLQKHSHGRINPTCVSRVRKVYQALSESIGRGGLQSVCSSSDFSKHARRAFAVFVRMAPARCRSHSCEVSPHDLPSCQDSPTKIGDAPASVRHRSKLIIRARKYLFRRCWGRITQSPAVATREGVYMYLSCTLRVICTVQGSCGLWPLRALTFWDATVFQRVIVSRMQAGAMNLLTIKSAVRETTPSSV